MCVRAFTGGAFAENGYLVTCAESGAAVVVDPGASADRMVAAAAAEGLELEGVLLTHAHLDHIEGVHVVREAFPSAPIWLHPGDLALYRALPSYAAAFGVSVHPQPEPDRELVPGRAFVFGASSLDVRFTPGHAPGHVIFVSEEAGFALVGDVVFQGSIGRTDLPGGDHATLMASIRDEILTLPDEMTLHPGHGPATTVGMERLANPFLAGLGRGRLA